MFAGEEVGSGDQQGPFSVSPVKVGDCDVSFKTTSILSLHRDSDITTTSDARCCPVGRYHCDYALLHGDRPGCER